MVPQLAPAASQVLFVQPHWWMMPAPPQLFGA
jgi:hypothetical protein